MKFLGGLQHLWSIIKGGGPPGGYGGYPYGGGPAFSDAFRFRRAPSPAELVESYTSLIFTLANINANAVAKGTLRLMAVTRGGQNRPKCAVRPLGRREKMRVKALGGYTAKTMAGAEEVEEVTSHPLLTALKSGNEEMDEIQTLQFLSLSLDVVGTAYLWPDVERSKIPAAFWALPPQYVYPQFTTGSMVPDRYQFGSVSFERSEVIRFRRLSLKNPVGSGMSPTQAAFEYARLEHTYVSITDNMLSNGPRPELIVSHKDPKGNFGEAERARLENDLNRRGRGGRAGGVFVADGAVSLAPINYSPADLSGLEISKYDMERCAGCFDVPISMLTSESSNRAVAEAGLEQHARNAVEPRQQIIAAGLTRYTHTLGRAMTKARGEDSGYDRLMWVFDPIVESDKAAQAELHKTYVSMGLPLNTALTEAGYEAVEDGDTPLIPNSLATLSSIVHPPAPAAPPAPGAQPGDDEEADDKETPGDDAEEPDDDAADESDAEGEAPAKPEPPSKSLIERTAALVAEIKAQLGR